MFNAELSHQIHMHTRFIPPGVATVVLVSSVTQTTTRTTRACPLLGRHPHATQAQTDTMLAG